MFGVEFHHGVIISGAYTDMSADKRKVIFDCDAGTDDAVALMMALVDPGVDIIAITAVGGNAPVHHTAPNVLRVLKLCGRLDVCFITLYWLGTLVNTYDNAIFM